MSNSTTIVSSFLDFVPTFERKGYYVGIASDPEVRLFTQHNVSREHGRWKYMQASNENEARNAEKILTSHYGFKGNVGGGNNNSIYVYCYRITTETNE